LIIVGRSSRIREIGHRHGRVKARLEHRLRRAIWERGCRPSIGKNGELDRRIKPGWAEAVAADGGIFVAEITFGIAIFADPVERLRGPLAGCLVGIKAAGAGENESGLIEARG
jgi:hypothetical protein